MTHRQRANTRVAEVNSNMDRVVTRRMKIENGISRLTLGEIGNLVSVAALDATKGHLVKKEISQPANKIVTRTQATAKTRIPVSVAAVSTNINAGNRQVSAYETNSKNAKAEKKDPTPAMVELLSCPNLVPGVSQVTMGDVQLEPIDHNIAPMDISGNGTDVSEPAANVEDIDTEDMVNPQLVSVYVNSIYSYLRQLETKFNVRQNLLDGSDITGKMRGILLDWLCQVHNKFHLLQETFYITVSIVDRYLQVKPCKRSRLQLVGVTAMLIASKYEEMHAPEVADFVYITDNAYTKQDVLDMEQDILYAIDFSLGRPHCLHFLRRNSKAGEVSATEHMLAKYLMELAVIEYDMAHLRPSFVAAAATCLSMIVLGNSTWSPTLEFYCSYSSDEIQPLVHRLAQLVVNAQTSKLTAVKTKHSSSKFMQIARIPQLKSKTLLDLAKKAQT